MFQLSEKEIQTKIILSNEKILAQFGIAKTYVHFWIVLGVLILIISMLISLFFISDFWLAILLGLAIIGYAFYLSLAYFYFLTDQRIIFYYRFFHTHLVSINYKDITDLNVRESFFEKIFFDSGNLVINTAGTPQEEIIFLHIAQPHLIKRKIEEIKLKDEKSF
ncbi:MAG: PH domain-containing protein [Patescibacteria group bacterium]|nr:PH domain-containing protein [Patescibacteria group bacterium]